MQNEHMKNTTMKNFILTKFLGSIKFDSPILALHACEGLKIVNSPFKAGWPGYFEKLQNPTLWENQ